MSRAIKALLWSSIGVTTAVAICMSVLLHFDWNQAKPWLSARVSEATGRSFAINGDLKLGWHGSQDGRTGWRHWIPWPHLSAQDVTLSNPDWATAAPHTATIRRINFSIDPLPLLDKKIVIPTLLLEQPTLTLERARDGKNNWSVTSNQNGWQLVLKQLVMNKGAVRYVDAIKHADLKAEIESLDQDASSEYGIGWTASGWFNGARVKAHGKTGNVLSLQEETRPFPLEAHVHTGKTDIDAEGTLTEPKQLAALDVRLKLSGASMAHLYRLTGIVLPETPRYSTTGRLIGILNRQGGSWTYDKFSGRVGSSDLSGSLHYVAHQPRPLLTGTLVSTTLHFKDLAPLIGADSNSGKIDRDAAPVQPANKILPVERFKTERWNSIDADVKFTGGRIIRDKDLPIDNLVTEIHLRDGVMTLTPLNFGVAGGNLVSNIKFDGHNHIIKAEMKISARHIKLKQLFPTFQPMQASLGEINGDARLSATGNSVATMLGSSNGEVKALINQGTISKLLLEQMGLNIGNVIMTKLFGDKQVRLRCMAGDFSVTNGLMQTRTFVVDTDDASLGIDGQINLMQERLNLTIHPDSKKLRLISLRAPLYVNGTFQNPEVRIDKGVLALKAGSAITLGLLAPVATALVPLVNLGPGEDSDCAKLLADARITPTAPPPGKTYHANVAAR